MKTFGIFKSVYRGYGIYWSGKYNVEGDGFFDTITEARKEIDRHIQSREEYEEKQKIEKINSGKYIVASRDGDDIFLDFPDGHKEKMTIRKFRQEVWDIEEKFDCEILHV